MELGRMGGPRDISLGLGAFADFQDLAVLRTARA